MLVTPRSKEFDDVYFSAENGLAETQHVFLAGNSLPERWVGRQNFTIAETGFGTGLNFLAAWKLFEETAAPDQTLRFISFEKFPLSKEEIRAALMSLFSLPHPHPHPHPAPANAPHKPSHPSPMGRGEGERGYKEYLEVFLKCYAEGTTQVTDRVTLTLIFGDVNEEIVKQNFRADAWFLDGFKPSTNPEMWSETVFQNMRRLSAPGATLATFTAAGFVRRGLKAAGFEVKKVHGYGRKREMIIGVKCG